MEEMKVTNNYFLNCSVCETGINIRAQIGYYDIPFNIHCPNCNTHIYGKLLINQDTPGVKLDIENAHLDTTRSNVMNNQYCAELSAEFPTCKMYLRNFDNYELSPFIRNGIFYNDDKVALEETHNAMIFSQHFGNSWKKLKVLYRLLWNGQESILYPKLVKELSIYDYIPISSINNQLDANMALHQLLITTTGITKALKPDTIGKYMKVSKLITDKKENFSKVNDYINDNTLLLDEIEKKAFKFVDAFSNIYEQLIPVVALRNADCLGNVDYEKYGIMTTNFDELSNFYAGSYEWILDNIDIVIALNNIACRSSYNDCLNNKTYKDIKKIGSKYKKLDFIDDAEPFSPPTSNLKNRVRNAIQHVDAEINYMSQEIIFKDTHRGNTKEVRMYLIEFADLCVENFSVVIYLLELVYNLKKRELVSNGQIPCSVYDNRFQEVKKNNTRKVGRNEPCPCGSGKKYKHCCL